MQRRAPWKSLAWTPWRKAHRAMPRPVAMGSLTTTPTHWSTATFSSSGISDLTFQRHTASHCFTWTHTMCLSLTYTDALELSLSRYLYLSHARSPSIFFFYFLSLSLSVSLLLALFVFFALDLPFFLSFSVSVSFSISLHLSIYLFFLYHSTLSLAHFLALSLTRARCPFVSLYSCDSFCLSVF